MTIPLAPTMATWFHSTRSLPGKRPQTPTRSSSWRTCGKHSANRMQTSRRSTAPVSKALNCHSSRHTAHLFWVRRFCHQKSVCKPCNGSPSVVAQGELVRRLCLCERVLPQARHTADVSCYVSTTSLLLHVLSLSKDTR